MNHKSSRLKNTKRLNNPTFVLSLLAVAALLGSAIFIAAGSSLSLSSSNENHTQWAGVSEDDKSAAIDMSQQGFFAPEVQRVVYPYSVIPGGVRTPAELREVSTHDPVVGEHYAGFDFQKARVIKLKQAQLVYVSYRIGDKIYWTNKKLNLPKGERLITDGKITGRIRCANRVAVLPQRGVFPGQPTIALFDKPIALGSSIKMPFPGNFRSALQPGPLPSWGAPAAGLSGPFALAAGGFSPLGAGYIPIGSSLIPGSGCSGGGMSGGTCTTTSPGPGPGPGPGAHLVPVPEPVTLELVVAEFVAMMLGWKHLSRKAR